MKVLSYNVRGLGGGEKRLEVRRLVQEKQPSVLCIQESKLMAVSERLVESVWGAAPCGFTVWDTSRVDVWSSMSFGHVLIIKGKDITSSEEFTIVNVYAPCDLEAKKELWERLCILALSNENLCLYMCGDFNSVR